MIHWLSHTLRGVCMGLADAVPGVSGGTLALILGIYARFIAAISAIGPGLLRAMLGRPFWSALGRGLRDPNALREDPTDSYARHVLFLAFLGAGIAGAIVVGARFIPTLLDLYPSQMKGLFFGLVLASVGIPWRMIKRRNRGQFIALALGAALAWLFVGMPIDASGNAQGEVVLSLAESTDSPRSLARANLVFLTSVDGDASHGIAYAPKTDLVIPPGETTLTIPVIARLAGTAANLGPQEIVSVRGAPEGSTVNQDAPITGGVNPSLWFLFLAGMIAISAMVLPGVSGSFILLVFGLYHYITFSLRQVIYVQDPDALVAIGVFMAALVVGITTFSRLLSALFKRQHDLTMALLVGLMVGSLRKIWPWTATDPAGVEFNTLPQAMDEGVALTLGLFLCGAALVTAIGRLGRQKMDGSEA